jgi:hypothetical protein
MFMVIELHHIHTSISSLNVYTDDPRDNAFDHHYRTLAYIYIYRYVYINVSRKKKEAYAKRYIIVIIIFVLCPLFSVSFLHTSRIRAFVHHHHHHHHVERRKKKKGERKKNI